MAGRGDELNVRLVADDQASKVIDKVADKVDALDKSGDTEVELSAQDRATAEVDALMKRLDRLSDDDRTLVLKARADQLERELRKSERLLANVRDMADDEVAIRVTARDNAQAELDEVRRRMRDLDGDTATVRVEARGLDDITDKLDAMPGQIGQIAGQLKGLAGPAAVGAIAGGLLAAADHATDAALAVEDLRNLTGDTAEFASRLQAVWLQTGAEGKDLQDVLLQMNGVLADAPELAARLGINLNDGRTAGERFVQVVGRLQTEVDDATERGVLGSKLFGEEGVRQVNAIKSRVGDLATAMGNLPDAMVFTEDEIEAAKQLARDMLTLKTRIGGVALELTEKAIPAMQAFLNLSEGDAGSAWEWVTDTAYRVSGLEWTVNQFRETLSDEEQAADDAADANRMYGESAEKVDQAIRLAISSQTDYTKGQRLVEDSIRAAIEAQEDEARATAELSELYDRQTRRAEDLLSAKLRLIGGDIGVRESQRRAADALKAYNDAMTDGKSDTAALAAAQDDAASSMLEAANAAADYAADQAAANGQTFTAADRHRALRDQLSFMAGTLAPDSPLRRQLMQYAAELDRIPREITTRLRVTGQTVTRDGDITRVRPTNGQSVAGATGAVVTRPTVALIGEAGPEAVVPLNQTNGASPLGSTTAAGAGGDTIINVDVKVDARGSLGIDETRMAARLVEILNRAIRNGGVRLVTS